MNVIIWVLEAVKAINEGFWIFLLIDLSFERKINNNREQSFFVKNLIISVPAICYAITIIVVQSVFSYSLYGILAGLICSTIAGLLLWKCNVILSMAITGIYSFAGSLINKFIMSLAYIIGGGEMVERINSFEFMERMFFLMIWISIWFFINMVFYQIIKEKNFDKRNFKYNQFGCALSYIGVLHIVIQIVIIFSKKISIVNGLVIAIIVACIVAPYFIIKQKDLANRLRLVEERNSLLVKNYDAVSDYYMANAKLNHDMKHHLNIVNTLLMEGENEEAKEYIQGLKEMSEQYSKKTYTGVNIFDVILSDKESRAKNRGIEFAVNAQFLPQDMRIDKKDLCAVLANILENALESCDKGIFVKIKIYKRMLLIKVENDFVTEPVKEEGYYKTAKGDKISHGWGLKSVMSVVEKYDGSMKIGVEEQKFVVDVMMNF